MKSYKTVLLQEIHNKNYALKIQALLQRLNKIIDVFDQENEKFLKKTLPENKEKIELPDEIISKEENQIDYKTYRSESKLEDCNSSNSVDSDEEKTAQKRKLFEFPEIMCIVCSVLLFVVIFLLIVLLYLRKRIRIIET